MEVNKLEQIYKIMSDNDYDEIEFRLGQNDKVKMVRSLENTKVISKEKENKEINIQINQNKDSEEDTNKTEIRSELVGVFQFMDEDETFFPKVGDEVAMGEKLGKILSLNSTKEIKSPIDGRISEISVKKNDIVDYGRLLFVIEDLSSIKA